MCQSKHSHQRRAGYCLSSPRASLSVSPGYRDSSAENVRQQLIKAYLRRPVLDGPEAGYLQSVSLAESIDQVERMLDGCEPMAA